jgi:DNA-binding CsgD family transcriptional regulator
MTSTIPPTSVPALTLPFIGREREFEQIARARAAAASGHGQVLFLSGDAGVGKTRLVQESARVARAEGWQVAIGYAYPLETAIPYASFADAIGPVLAALDPGALMRLTRGDRAILAALAPALSPTLVERGGTLASMLSEGVPPAEQRVRLHTTILQVLTKLAEKHPLLLCLENVQWADSASVELLHFLGRQVGTQRLLLIVNWNETDRPLPDDLRIALRSLRALGAATDLRLTPLSVEEVRTLLARLFAVDAAVVDRFAARLHHATQGNAFFLDQTLRELVTRGDLRLQGGIWVGWHVETLALPPSVLDVLAQRLARLSPEARRLADVIGVAGSSATHDVVRAMFDRGEDAMHAGLLQLRENGIIVERAEADGVAYLFAHPMMQRAVVERVGLARERELHATLAGTIERLAGPRAASHTEAIARHWLHADPRTQPGTAVRWLVAAGHQALARLARREAAAMLRAALDRADAHPDDVPAGTADALVDELMRVYRRLGDHQHALAMCKRGIEQATAIDSVLQRAIAERRYALALQALARREESLAHFDLAIEHARRAGAASLVVRTQLAKADSMQALGMVEEAKREVADAVTTAERLDDLSLLARAHRLLLMLHIWSGPAHRAWSYARRAVHLAERSGERNLRWQAHFGAAVLGGLTSQTRALATHLAEATRLAEELASPALELRCAEIALEYAAGIGEWDRAITEGERAVAMARAFDQVTLLARLLHWVSGVYLQRGDVLTAQRLVQEAWDVSGAAQLDLDRPYEVHGVLPAYVARTRYLDAVGERAEALRHGHVALEMAQRTGYIAWAVYRLLPTMADAALVLGDHATLAIVRTRLAHDASYLAHPIGTAWVSVIDGEAAHEAQRYGEAITQLQRAIAQLEAVPFPFDAAKTRLRLARVHADSGARDEAIHEAKEALVMFDQLGARPAAEDTRALLRELGARVASTGSGAPVDGLAALTSRELDIVRLVAQRLTNKEIGARLGITARTAGTHLANIFDKLGVRDRTALGDLARERGMHR